jgi:hypothetical protein
VTTHNFRPRTRPLPNRSASSQFILDAMWLLSLFKSAGDLLLQSLSGANRLSNTSGNIDGQGRNRSDGNSIWDNKRVDGSNNIRCRDRNCNSGIRSGLARNTPVHYQKAR